MKIERISQNDFNEVIGLISKEFSYIVVSNEKIEERILREDVFIFVAREKNELAGFIDLSLFGDKAAINGFSVREKYRKQGFGQKLLEFGVDFLNENNVQKIKLLVKKENKVAKKMYKKAGFSLIGLHPKKIDGKIIEEFELKNKKKIEKVFEKFVS